MSNVLLNQYDSAINGSARSNNTTSKFQYGRESMGLSESPITERSRLCDQHYSLFYYQIRGNKILRYSYNEFRSKAQRENILIVNESKNETYRGEMTLQAANRLRKKILTWYEAIVFHNNSIENNIISGQRKMVFLTLTLSSNQTESDIEVKEKILKPFLRILREKYGVRNYVWKAESQKNGNIHFHMIIDKFIGKQDIQNDWNKCQENLGYITKFFEKYSHYNAPSTRIEVVKDSKGVSKYIEKYISKNEHYRKIEGAVWKGSQSVMSLQFFEFVGDSQVEQRIIQAENEGKIISFNKERYSVYVLKNAQINEVLPDYINRARHSYYLLLNSFLFAPEIVQNFRDFCFLMSDQELELCDRKPFIATDHHPLPIQMSCFELKEIINTLNFRNK